MVTSANWQSQRSEGGVRRREEGWLRAKCKVQTTTPWPRGCSTRARDHMTWGASGSGVY